MRAKRLKYGTAFEAYSMKSLKVVCLNKLKIRHTGGPYDGGIDFRGHVLNTSNGFSL